MLYGTHVAARCGGSPARARTPAAAAALTWMSSARAPVPAAPMIRSAAAGCDAAEAAADADAEVEEAVNKPRPLAAWLDTLACGAVRHAGSQFTDRRCVGGRTYIATAIAARHHGPARYHRRRIYRLLPVSICHEIAGTL